MTEALSLRSVLGGGDALPAFAVVLPPHWIGQQVSAKTRDAMLTAARQRLMAAHRPDLYAQLSSNLQRAFADLDRVGTQFVFGPAPDAPDAAYLPASLMATVRSAPAGGTFADVLTHLVQRRGATALHGDARIVTFRETRSIDEGGQRVAVTSVHYLTPIPGTSLAKALQFTAALTHPVDVDADDDAVQELASMFDASISTFHWVAP